MMEILSSSQSAMGGIEATMASGGFSRQELQEMKEQFDEFDIDGDGHITATELDTILHNMGDEVSPKELEDLIASVDLDKSGTIEWNEFLDMVTKLREGKADADKGFAKVYTKKVKLNVMEGSSAGISHSFSDEEKVSFVEYINMELEGDEDLEGILPIEVEEMALFKAINNGILLCKLINVAVPDTIDERGICRKKKMNKFQIQENQNLVIQSAKGIGCNVVNIDGDDLMKGTPHLALGLIWQIVKIGLLSQVSLKSHPNLVRLLEPGEELEDFLKLSPEQILLRWFNYHLKNAGWHRTVKNFGPDIKDSENYTVLLAQIAPDHCNRDALNESDTTKRAEMVLDNADKIECKKFLKPKDIVAGNQKLNLAFVANLFNTWPALEDVEEKDLPVLEDDEGEMREARAFKMWMNSLPVDPEIDNFFEDIKDGIAILQVIDKIQPGIVNWKRVNKPPFKLKFKKIENCNYAVDLGKQLGFSLVGIAGSDIVDGNKKLTLAIVWQCMRMSIIKYIENLSQGGKKITDMDLVNWANDKVSEAGKESSIKNFRDKSMKNSKFLLDLLDACKPGSVEYDLVEEGNNDEEKKNNAKYAITIARKSGCSIFCLWEDIVEVKPKMILTFVGAVMEKFN